MISSSLSMLPLRLPSVGLGGRTFHEWLSVEPGKDRLRDISKGNRTLAGLARWPLGWLEVPGVVCYERAVARIAAERGGRADAAFVQGLVKTVKLPTAVANASDHYVVVARGTQALRARTIHTTLPFTTFSTKPASQHVFGCGAAVHAI